MDAFYRPATLQNSAVAFSPVTVRRAVAFALLALVFFAAALILERRVARALIEPLSSPALIVLGLFSVLAIAAARLLNRQSLRLLKILGAKVPCDWWIVLPPVAIAITICVPGSPIFGISAFWLLIIAEETWAWRRGRSGFRVQGSARLNPELNQAAPTDSPPGTPRSALPLPHSEFHTPDSPQADWADPNLSQRLTYRITAEGAVIEGWFRAVFAPGQRVAVVHIAFCPAFENTPEVESEPWDGTECEIRPTTILPWGIRWEIKRAVSADDGAETIAGFSATGSAFSR
jgi:hypothetical protein